MIMCRAAVFPQFQLDLAVLEEHLEEVKRHKADLLLSCGVADVSELMSNNRFADLLKRFGEKLSLEGDRAIRFFGGFKTQMLR